MSEKEWEYEQEKNKERSVTFQPLFEDFHRRRVDEDIVRLDISLLHALHALDVNIQNAYKACNVLEGLVQCPSGFFCILLIILDALRAAADDSFHN